jgi:hypothetical protein
MAVEYIDSPNAGFVKLGEKVGLSTITPERKRKVKRGDRSVFPITPTGAESYEDTDFRPAKGFTTPASAIPNVFDRYKDLPGGARADAEIPFTQPIFNPNPNQTEESKEEDADLEEQLRRRSLDFDPVSDYDLSRFDPNSPNFNSTAAGEQAYADVLTGGDFFSSLDRFGVDQFSGEAATISFNALEKANSDIERAQNLVNKTQAGTRIGNFALDALESANKAQQELQIVNDVIGKRGAAPSGVPTTIPEQQKDFRGLTANQARFFSGQNVLGSVGGTGFTTNVPKASFDTTGGIDPFIFDPAPSPSPSGVDTIIADPFDRNVPEFTGPDVGPAPTPAGGGTEPTDFTEFSFDFGDIDMGGLGADAPAPEFDPTGGIDPSQLNRGGKVQSFMNMKK